MIVIEINTMVGDNFFDLVMFENIWSYSDFPNSHFQTSRFQSYIFVMKMNDASTTLDGIIFYLRSFGWSSDWQQTKTHTHKRAHAHFHMRVHIMYSSFRTFRRHACDDDDDVDIIWLMGIAQFFVWERVSSLRDLRFCLSAMISSQRFLLMFFSSYESWSFSEVLAVHVQCSMVMMWACEFLCNVRHVFVCESKKSWFSTQWCAAI